MTSDLDSSTSSSPGGAYTTEQFWEHFWRNVSLPARVDLDFKNDRVIASTMEAYLSAALKELPSPRYLEVGCAPGKWLIFAAETWDCKATGIEYLASAVRTTEQNLALCNVAAQVECADFLTLQPRPAYDVVASYGFIEHFQDYDSVFQRHLEWLKPGGWLVLSLPRFRGLTYFVQKLIDVGNERPLLPEHNLRVMSRGVFARLGRKYHLEILFNGCIGGFEPGLFPVTSSNIAWRRNVAAFLIRVFRRLFGNCNYGFCGSYQMSIYRKPV